MTDTRKIRLGGSASYVDHILRVMCIDPLGTALGPLGLWYS